MDTFFPDWVTQETEFSERYNNMSEKKNKSFERRGGYATPTGTTASQRNDLPQTNIKKIGAD